MKNPKRDYTIVKALGTFLSTFSLTGIIVEEAIEKSALFAATESSLSAIMVAFKASHR